MTYFLSMFKKPKITKQQANKNFSFLSHCKSYSAASLLMANSSILGWDQEAQKKKFITYYLLLRVWGCNGDHFSLEALSISS